MRKIFFRIKTSNIKSSLKTLRKMGLDFLQISPISSQEYEILLKTTFFIGKNAKHIKKTLIDATDVHFIVFDEEGVIEIREIE